MGSTDLLAQDTLVIGAKNFTESALLAEIMAQTIEEHTDLEVERRFNLGGTMICWAALQAGEIDLYPEYTGTGWAALLGESSKVTDPLVTFLTVRRRFEFEHQILWMDPFGLNNTYAIAMPEEQAKRLGIARISDLVDHQAGLRAGFSIEFGNREDGYLGLAKAYGLEIGQVRVLEHGLAYEALRTGEIDLIDAYSTDAKLLRYKLRVLDDDLSFFPPYNAAPLLRQQSLEDQPELGAVLAKLAFRISDSTAQALNDLVESEGQSFKNTARAFLEQAELVEGHEASASQALQILESHSVAPMISPSGTSAGRPGFFARLQQDKEALGRRLFEHLTLTLAAVLLAALIAIPLGILITKRQRLAQLTLGFAGILQTVPSLALLAFMIPIFGLNVSAAIMALFLYALLPILRNTYTGITEVDGTLVEAAQGMGLRPREVLLRIQLPLAMRTIMAGIRTSTVISIGVATLAAFIGSGGLGEPIVEGLYLNDPALILTGAVPAALLAVLADFLLGRIERSLQRPS
jgi:osmoprotectant transport system permease protein